ncbi:MAG: helix-turn-helix domain-containing protein [Prevotella sp.]|jgi:AraC-like DNA-binding protein
MRIYTLLIVLLFSLCVNASKVGEAMQTGRQCIAKGDWSGAIVALSPLKDAYEQGDRSPQIANGLQYCGNCYAYANRYIEALDYYILGSKAADELKRPDIYEGCMNNIGMIYAIFKDYEKAAFYFEKVYESVLKRKDDAMLAIILINLTNVYCHLNQPEKAKTFFKMQMMCPIRDKIQQQFFSLFNQGLIAKTEHNYSGAIYYLRQAISSARSHGVKSSHLAEAYIELGGSLSNRSLDSEAKTAFLYARDIAQKNHDYEQLAEAYEALTTFYREHGREDSALICQQRWLNISDSVFNARQFDAAKDRLFRYENQKTEQHIGQLHGTINRQYAVIGIILVFFVFVSVLLVVVIYNNRRVNRARRLLVSKNQELIKHNEEIRRMYDEIAHQNNKTTDEISNSEAPTASHQYSITQVQKAVLLSEINQVMSDEKNIANPDFSLGMLSKIINSNPKYVSQVINDTYGKNFKTFLNEYRIHLACQRLADEDYMRLHTLSALATEVGFNSHNTFTNAFKRITGMTPSVYRHYIK